MIGKKYKVNITSFRRLDIQKNSIFIERFSVSMNKQMLNLLFGFVGNHTNAKYLII